MLFETEPKNWQHNLSRGVKIMARLQPPSDGFIGVSMLDLPSNFGGSVLCWVLF